MPIKKDLHIISFNIPFPANYGGVIDVFYKIVALSKIGVNIHLHCFKYGRKQDNELNKYCKNVYYYNRKMKVSRFFTKTPFIVESRTSKSLISRLIKDDYPILIEGLHCSQLLKSKELRNRKKFIRMHNIESDYYKHLAQQEHNPFKKFFLYSEYLKIVSYQNNLKYFDGIFSISKNDHNFFKTIAKSIHVRAFHPNNNIHSKLGKGQYALYHANLSVSENYNAALFLIKNIFSKMDYPFVIAGKNPTKKLIQSCYKYQNVKLISNPDHNTMKQLVSDAQVILLYTKQNTGIKLKLLESLYNGRYCIANKTMIENTELESFCIESNSSLEWQAAIKKFSTKEFSIKEKEKRFIIDTLFNNEKEAQKIYDAIFLKKQE